ncbi:SAM-dependent methyltransferase [Pleomorphomonas koreensis]|uniref:SAM-dependent methyltransferase n=1 Tax=Pleomorphomonas koreensis TaxID=257440 RepID=UPI000403D031|nr:SAM-dependent methyltransferase [Pleomorphomonas koreensis]
MTAFDNRAVVNRKAPGSRPELFPTPPWAGRALCGEVLVPLGLMRRGPEFNHIVDPACGTGHLVHALDDFGRVSYSDVHPWPMIGEFEGVEAPVFDFLTGDPRHCPEWHHFHGGGRADWVITNPPFSLAADFWSQSYPSRAAVAHNVALLCRTNWVEGQRRFRSIFSHSPPTTIVHSSDRIPMIEGVWDPEATTATCYSWFVWVAGAERRPDIWLPPGMAKKWTRKSDAAFAVPGEAKRRKAAREAEKAARVGR